MPMKRIALYMRVSTDMQQTASQRDTVQEYLNEILGAEVTVYEDLAVSGKTLLRPRFQDMLRDVQEGKVDTIVTYALDRISRNSSDALRMVLGWRNAGVGFVSVTQPHLCTEDAMPFQNTILAAHADLAQLERQAIVTRIKAGIRAKRAAQGGEWGRRSVVSIQDAQRARELARAGRTVRQIAQELGHSSSTIQRTLSKV